MVALGYPGEIQDDLAVVYTLVVGLAAATSKQGSETVSSLISSARYLTVISWCTYPFVYIVKMLGLAGPTATTYEQVGYSVADVVAKAVFGVLIWAIASEKSKLGVVGRVGA